MSQDHSGVTSPVSKLNIFVPINKIDEEQRLVYGTAAAEVLDNSGEMFDYEGSKPFFEKWSENAFATSDGKSYGNIRVMHTAKVAGIVSAPLGFNDNAKTIECVAKVIDDGEWAMVKAGGYTGFSMGGRYVSRATKSDGVKTYVADPVEISLVDKPCIPTAVFSVVKADGTEEQHRFRDDLYQAAPAAKSDTGENVMYVPTNDETLPVARELAKAAGKDGPNDWIDFMEAARAELVAKHDGGQQQSETPADNTDAPGQAEANDANKADVAHTDEDCKVENCDKCAAAKGDNPFPKEKAKEEDGEASEDGEEGEDKDKEKAKKSDAPELEQGWRAKDGSFFAKKADALAHNESLNKADEPSLIDKLRGISDVVGKIASGEEIVTEEAEPIVEKSDIEVMADNLDAIIKIDHGGTLAKGMSTVSRTANLLRDLASLNIAVSREAKREGDNSTLPGEIGIAVGQMGNVLIAMAKEEVEELMMQVASGGKTGENEYPSYYDDYCCLAASTLGLEKSALIEKMNKREVPANPAADVMQKLDAANQRADEAVAKADALQKDMDEITPLVTKLSADLEAIKKMPLGKAPTTSRAVSKSDDVAGLEAPAAPAGDVLSKFTPEQLTDAAIRLSQQHGRRIGQ